ncbi:hybrid sensor histidine kinase/response regulator [Stutzerimonas tarimensis]|uniref:histidine kinase n=1 Tax=Stutzerimonas tarimensis TaxID=1507735 RepID=A0ABV7T4W7_9GAMM
MQDSSPVFLRGGGETGEQLRARDWTKSPLGPATAWPAQLGTLVSVMLGSSQAMHIVWGASRILLYNDAQARLLGPLHPAALGTPLGQVWSQAEQALLDHDEAGSGFRPRVGLPADSPRSSTSCDLTYHPVPDEQGRVLGFFCSRLEPVRSALAMIDAGERQFQALAQAIPALVWTCSADGLLGWCNDRFCDYAGLERERLLDEGWADLVHPDDLPAVVRDWHEALERREPYQSRARLRRADGVYRCHLGRGVPLLGERGEVIRWVGANTDIEELKLAEEQLRELADGLEQRFAARTAEYDRVWRNSRDLLIVVGLDGIYRAANPAWQTILGYAPEEVVGHRFDEFIVPEDLELTHAAHARAVTSLQLTNLEKRYRHKDGSLRWISWSTSTEGDCVYGYGRDVTAEKEQALALRQAEDQLRQAQKMEAVGQLTGGIAHDFNNLLGGILGSLELLQLRIAQGRTEQAERYCKMAIGSGQRAAALIHRLLAFARRQPLDPHPVDVARLLEDMADLLRRTLGPAHRLEIAAAADLWITRCDPNGLENTLLNLVINARDAMPGGGTLRLEAGNVAAGALGKADIDPGDYVWLSVSDSGIGMSREILERVLEPFFTTKAPGQGTGLGLPMVYGFAKQSQGHLRLASEPGHGTRVTLYLPRFIGEPEEQATSRIEAARHDGRKTVLIVEDDAVIRELVAEVLQDLGYRTLTATDGPSGLEILRSDSPLDLLVSDIGLPGFDGHRLADLARELMPALKVLFITGYADDAVGSGGFLGPGMELITKPFDMGDLTAKVQGLTHSR